MEAKVSFIPDSKEIYSENGSTIVHSVPTIALPFGKLEIQF